MSRYGSFHGLVSPQASQSRATRVLSAGENDLT